MTEENRTEESPLKNFKPSTKTVWDRMVEREFLYDVRSLGPPPGEIAHRESCGRLRLNGENAEDAAIQYRKIKKLPDDWPVSVTTINTKLNRITAHETFEPSEAK